MTNESTTTRTGSRQDGTNGVLRRTLPLAAWAALVVTGFSVLAAYEFTPGAPANPPARAEATISAAPTKSGSYTLVMTAHPRCPCSRASMSELAVLMTHLQGRLSATVWFYTPEGAPADWARSSLWKSAAALPGVVAKEDPEGRMAESLGAHTSGQVLLFDPSGQRVFAGGITGARGHEGDNPGRRAVESLVLGETSAATPASTPVFGCSLRAVPSAGDALVAAAGATVLEPPGGSRP